MEPEYYTSLGLDPGKRKTYSLEDIKAAYRQKAKENKDALINPDSPLKENLQNANIAYGVLGEVDGRRQYDRSLDRPASTPRQYHVHAADTSQSWEDFMRESERLMRQAELKELMREVSEFIERNRDISERAKKAGLTFGQQLVEDHYKSENPKMIGMAAQQG